MDRSEPIPDHRAHYKEHGWVQIKRVLPIEVADATLYKMQQELGGDWESYKGDYIKTFLTDKRAFECYSHDYSPMATLQYGLTPYISTLVGKDLLPTHCYFRVYRKGDICHVHSDAHACEHAMSLTLGYSNDYLWEFNISDKYFEADVGKPVEAAQRESHLGFHNLLLSVGDGVLYNGINYLHGRVKPNPNEWTAQIFLHWVDRAGKYAHHAFDGRTADLVKRAEFKFPEEGAPEKINPNRADPVKERGHE